MALLQIATEILDAREAARTRVHSEDVLRYFGDVTAALSQIRPLKQMINMDESGFCSRMDKGRKRKCVISKTCPVHPTFREDDAASQLTIVSTICLSGEALRPMFITKERLHINGNFQHDAIFQLALHFSTAKGYQTEDSMVYWVENCLLGYVQSVQRELEDPEAPVFLIMDNCTVHNAPRVREAFGRIAGLKIIWLPAHASHFLQMLDACYFGVMKAEYRQGKMEKMKPKVAGKVVRAFRAAHKANWCPTIMRSWEMTGFTYVGLGTPTPSARLSLETVVALTSANCPDFAEFVGEAWKE